MSAWVPRLAVLAVVMVAVAWWRDRMISANERQLGDLRLRTDR